MSLRRELYRGRHTTPLDSTPTTTSVSTSASARESPAPDGQPHWVRDWYAPPLASDSSIEAISTINTISTPTPNIISTTTNNTPSSAATPTAAIVPSARVKTWVFSQTSDSLLGSSDEKTDTITPEIDLSQWSYLTVTYVSSGPQSEKDGQPTADQNFKAAVSNEGGSDVLFGSSAPS
jgi:hypothetical protein